MHDLNHRSPFVCKMRAAAIHRDRCSSLTIAALVTRDRPMGYVNKATLGQCW
jgi:hypothetical protein